MRYTPADPLELETRYVVTVGEGISDLAGNVMTETPPPFEFATAGRPMLLGADPADGAEDVPLDAPIVLTFSTSLMDTASVEDQLRLSPAFEHELLWSGELLEIVPAEPLEPDRAYEISIGSEAADVAGVTFGEEVRVTFRTVAPGLAAETLVPADGVDGIAPISPIAVIFDRPIDPDSVAGDQLTINPGVAGTLEVVSLPDDPPDDDGAGSVLQFTPSGPLPSNTTFEVELAPEVAATTGDTMGEPLRWSFTTGAPTAAISNAIVFVTDRAGIANVWAMNPDGTGQRQITAELDPIVDYAVAPDGSSLVVSDGRHLVYQRADGTARRVLTDAAHIEFDPTYAPDGERVAFARADAESGAGLGLWEWPVGGGDAAPIELPDSGAGTPAPAPSTLALRAPRYAPDGEALAFIDVAGFVGILDPSAGRLAAAPFVAAAAPIWMADSTAVLLTGSRTSETDPETTFVAPVRPLASGPSDAVHRLARTGSAANELRFGVGSAVLAVGMDGRVAYADRDGRLRIAESPLEAPFGPALTEEAVFAAALAPGEPSAVVAIDGGALVLVDFATEERMPLGASGADPRWLP